MHMDDQTRLRHMLDAAREAMEMAHDQQRPERVPDTVPIPDNPCRDGQHPRARLP